MVAGVVLVMALIVTLLTWWLLPAAPAGPRAVVASEVRLLGEACNEVAGVVLGTDDTGLTLAAGGVDGNTPVTLDPALDGSTLTVSSNVVAPMFAGAAYQVGAQTLKSSSGTVGGLHLVNPLVNQAGPVTDMIIGGGHRPNFLRVFTNGTYPLTTTASFPTVASPLVPVVVAQLITNLSGVNAINCDTWHFRGTLGLTASAAGATFQFYISQTPGAAPGGADVISVNAANTVAIGTSGAVVPIDAWLFTSAGEAQVTNLYLLAAMTAGTQGTTLSPTATTGGWMATGYGSSVLMGTPSSRF